VEAVTPEERVRRERRHRWQFFCAVVICGLGLASFGSALAGDHRLTTELGWALVAISVTLLATLLARRP
jgi:hypothetical protein